MTVPSATSSTTSPYDSLTADSATGPATAVPQQSLGQSELSKPARDMLREAQRRLHKMLLLDRENEALLLRCAIYNGGLPSGTVKIGAGQLAKTYGRYV